MSDFQEDMWMWIVVGLILLGLLVFAILRPKFEAETYTRLTGKQVTYWDAVWLDLRIQEQVR